jgi:uncharacterized membrane protein
MTDRRVSDLGLVAGLVVAATAALLVPGVPWPVRWALGVPLLLVAPGYGVVAALFPESPDASRADAPAPPDWIARFGLSLVGSVVVVGVVGVVLASRGILRLAPAVLLIGGVSLAGVALARVRRGRLPESRRAAPLADRSLVGATRRFGTSSVQTLVLFVAVLTLVSALAFAAGTPATGEAYSEVYLPADANPGLDAEAEALTLTDGEATPVRVAVDNHEGRPTAYAVVVQLQRLDADGSVVDGRRLAAFDLRLAPGETGVVQPEVAAPAEGDRTRLRVLVHKGGEATGAPDLALRVRVAVGGNASTSTADGGAGNASTADGGTGNASTSTADGGGA